MSEFFNGLFCGYALVLIMIVEVKLLMELKRGVLLALLLRKSDKRKV
jgi:hypothetical protein